MLFGLSFVFAPAAFQKKPEPNGFVKRGPIYMAVGVAIIMFGGYHMYFDPGGNISAREATIALPIGGLFIVLGVIVYGIGLAKEKLSK